MASEFDTSIAEADQDIEQIMGEPVSVYYFDQLIIVQAVMTRDADVLRPAHNRLRKIKSHTVTLEFRVEQLPDVVYEELLADIDGDLHRVVDSDVEDGWLLLALVKAPADSTVDKNTDFFNLG